MRSRAVSHAQKRWFQMMLVLSKPSSPLICDEDDAIQWWWSMWSSRAVHLLETDMMDDDRRWPPLHVEETNKSYTSGGSAMCLCPRQSR